MTTDSARRPQAEDGEERARGSSHAPAARLRREGASSDCPGCKLNTSLRRRLISGHSSGLISLVLSATYDTLRWLSPSGISLLPWFQESEPSQLSHEGNTMHMDDQWSVPGQSLQISTRVSALLAQLSGSQLHKENRSFRPGAVAHAWNPSTSGGQGKWIT
ncbi:uncharacterized protein LOC108584750 isoform X5 [Papio anubis]|uniref:uncharacterized protein LOC108584750 isoform X5 n=1 Tax=Papio anubis TaxID=9555 RepID=UPI0012ADC3A5|nr:uncharacterized protein LOC108584750 isoform X5 [Papio anubis]